MRRALVSLNTPGCKSIASLRLETAADHLRPGRFAGGPDGRAVRARFAGARFKCARLAAGFLPLAAAVLFCLAMANASS